MRIGRDRTKLGRFDVALPWSKTAPCRKGGPGEPPFREGYPCGSEIVLDGQLGADAVAESERGIFDQRVGGDAEAHDRGRQDYPVDGHSTVFLIPESFQTSIHVQTPAAGEHL